MIRREGDILDISTGSASWRLYIRSALDTLPWNDFRRFWRIMKIYAGDDADEIILEFQRLVMEDAAASEDGKISPRRQARIKYMEENR